MVRPNQIADSGEGYLTFIMFARDESTVKRRVLLLNFPSVFIPKVLSGKDLSSFASVEETVTEGRVNRYKVKVNTEMI